MGKVILTAEERATISSILTDGLSGNSSDPQWPVARLALARSLQMGHPPSDDFARPSQRKGGVELHDTQVTGQGSSVLEDYRDIFAALLSVHDEKDYVTDPGAFDEAINRHIRRGLNEISTTWKTGFDFFDYLLQEMYFDRDKEPQEFLQQERIRLRELLERVLGQLGVASDIIKQEEGPRLTRFTVKLHGLEDLDRLRKGVGKIAFALGSGEDNSVTSSLAVGEKCVNVDIPRPPSSWNTITWTELAHVFDSDTARKMILPVCVGTDVLGKPFIFDLSEAPHLFIGGTTGSGKSMCVHALLLSLIRYHSTPPELVLIDPKSVEFTSYSGASAVSHGSPITDMDIANKVLDKLVKDMEIRQQRLGSLDARNLTEANERGAKLNRIVVVIDELADLFATHSQIEKSLVRLAQKARAVGIHLVLATQRPEAATFPGLLRSNIPSRIALSVQKASESRIIIDETGAESLLMRGDMLIRLAGKTTVRAHGCLVEPGDIIAEVK